MAGLCVVPAAPRGGSAGKDARRGAVAATARRLSAAARAGPRAGCANLDEGQAGAPKRFAKRRSGGYGKTSSS
jgi:hypothetical protein